MRAVSLGVAVKTEVLVATTAIDHTANSIAQSQADCDSQSELRGQTTKLSKIELQRRPCFTHRESISRSEMPTVDCEHPVKDALSRVTYLSHAKQAVNGPTRFLGKTFATPARAKIPRSPRLAVRAAVSQATSVNIPSSNGRARARTISLEKTG